MADNEVSKLTWIAIVVALAASIYFVAKPQINSLTTSTFGKISSVVEDIGKINPNNAKWVTKGNWGTNGKFVVDKDGNAVIYAIDTSKPIVFHNMETENTKLPKATLTTLTFQDKVQGDTNSSMAEAFNYTFAKLKTITNLGMNVDTSNVTDMEWMFHSSKITTVDLSQWNTSNVFSMRDMFWDSKLTSVGDLSQWNTSNVTNMIDMFSYSQLTTVGDLSQWDTSNVTSMGAMFFNSKLTSVGDLSQWNTSNVTSMGYMFRDSKLTTVGDLGKWDTSKVGYMTNMFTDSKLTPPAWYH